MFQYDMYVLHGGVVYWSYPHVMWIKCHVSVRFMTIENSRLSPHVKSMTSNNLLRKVTTQVNEVELSASERGSISTIISK